MKMKEMLEKVKVYFKDHKEEICGLICIGGLCGASAVFGYEMYSLCHKDELAIANNPIARVIIDARNQGIDGVFTSQNIIAAKPDELGRLGEDMINTGVPDDYTFTHFIAIC